MGKSPFHGRPILLSSRLKGGGLPNQKIRGSPPAFTAGGNPPRGQVNPMDGPSNEQSRTQFKSGEGTPQKVGQDLLRRGEIH